MKTDAREQFILGELRGLTATQLRRVLDTPPGQIVCDTFSYDESTGRYCTLAIAFGIPGCDGPRSNALVRRSISERMGTPMRTTSGIPGAFYTSDRENDIRRACTAILAERDPGEG